MKTRIVAEPESESEAEAEELGRKVMGGEVEEEKAVEMVKEVKPAVFLMRVITHDWPDSYVTRLASFLCFHDLRD